jgi:hypothetical protein
MASRPFQTFAPGFGRNALDLPVAALAAVAAAFAAFAMPGDLMAALVEASGLPALLSAAAPPLGLKARIGIGLIGAAGAFGLVFLLLRLLDRTGLESRRAAAELEEEEAPRLRRRDFHPDAPVRRPISAVRDLGEPAPPQPPIASLWPEAPAWEPEPEPAPAPAPVLPAEPSAEPVFAPAPARHDESLAGLMARLEQGLARRAQSAPAEPPVQVQAQVPRAFAEAGDDRLQSAIESLQRLAARD